MAPVVWSEAIDAIGRLSEAFLSASSTDAVIGADCTGAPATIGSDNARPNKAEDTLDAMPVVRGRSAFVSRPHASLDLWPAALVHCPGCDFHTGSRSLRIGKRFYQYAWVRGSGNYAERRTMKNILGRKVGMTSVFTQDGRCVPVTVIAAGPCTVVERKTKEKHGYDAVALGFGSVKRSRLTRALGGHFKKQGVEPVRFVREFRSGADDTEVGQSVTVAAFEPGDRVDVVGISKGHGFAGGIKRHNFSGGGASHGSMIHRQPASNGDTNAGRTVKGSRRPGHYGVDRTTMHILEVISADGERNLLLVRGAVPGSKNALVLVRQSVKTGKAKA
jgi:large subunit ribosomal protein L3